MQADKEIEEARVVCEQKVVRVAVSRDSRWIIAACVKELKACEVKTGVVKTFKDNSLSISASSRAYVSYHIDFCRVKREPIIGMSLMKTSDALNVNFPNENVTSAIAGLSAGVD